MSTRISYRDTPDVEPSRETALVNSARDYKARIIQLERSISQFIAKVSAVTFNVDEDEQESWMSNWQRHLANGSINATDATPDDQ